MEKVIMKNGIKLIYDHIENNLTSFTIGFEAGANVEKDEKLGIAHVVEHMIFKGTKKRNEYEINKLCDEIFGFCNAMTNYPYVIYYGTSLSEDFKTGFEIYSDIILNPTFPQEGFNEEINIICEELKEWKDDIGQYCEDEMLNNAFLKRRIKDLIIGTEDSIRSITLDDIINFYKKYYVPNNCVISVVSSLTYEEVYSIVEKYFCVWRKTEKIKNEYINRIEEEIYEENKSGIYIQFKKDIQGAKIQYCFPIHNLNEKEIKALRVFNSFFGEGTSCILYDEIRTKRGLVYDISTSIKNETGIKFYSITLSTSPKNINTAINIINEKIERCKNYTENLIEDYPNYLNEQEIQKLSKAIKLKRSLAIEKSIQLSMNFCVHEIMFGDGSQVFEQFEKLEYISKDDILKTVSKVLINPTIQILVPGDGS